MNIHYPATRIVVAGITQTGKTTFCERYISTAKQDVIMVFDWQSFEFAQRLNQQCLTSWEEVGDAWDSGQKIICFDPSNDTETDFDNICAFLLEVNSGCEKTVLLVGDELGQVFNHGKLPDDVKRAWVAGRRLAQLDILYVCHQLNEIHYSMRNHITEIACFRQNDKLGVGAATDHGIPEDVVSLQVGEYYWRDIKKYGSAEKHNLFVDSRNKSVIADDVARSNPRLDERGDAIK